MQLPTNLSEYQELMAHIETFLQKATVGGGFSALTPEEGTELAQLAKLAEAYEDSIPLMPVRMPQTMAEKVEFKM